MSGFGKTGVLMIALVAAAGPAAAAAITGVCPDGSVFIVQTRNQIPCAGAKEVEPSKIPPMRPENLPRPYLWEVYRERADTGRNPYHLLERAEEVRRGNAASPNPGGSQNGPSASSTGWRPPTPAAPQPTDLGLSEGEIRDLFFVVELSQQQVPVSFVDGERGRERLRVSFAHSRAFAERAQQVGLVPAGGADAVLLFSAVAAEQTDFHPNFTLVQGHLAFQPDAADAKQLGFLRGGMGALDPESVALGYLVLPPGFDLTRPVDLYWDDRRLEAERLKL